MIATAATIERIETLLVDVPTIRPHKLSVATMNCQTLVLVRVRCTDGIEGVGEATTIGGLAYGEEVESIKVNIDTYFAPLLQGMDATRPGAALARARKLFQGNRFAKCAIETALFDAQARRLGVPLSELFGGRRTDAVDVAWTLASGDTQRDIAEAEAMLDARRHRAFAEDWLERGGRRRRARDRDQARARRTRRCARRREPGVERNRRDLGRCALGGSRREPYRAADRRDQPRGAETPHATGAGADHGRRGAARPRRCIRARAGSRGRRVRGEDRTIGRPAGCGERRVDRGCSRHRTVRRHDARGRGRHDGVRATVQHVRLAEMGHRAVRPAAAHRGDPRRAAALRGFQAAPAGSARPRHHLRLEPASNGCDATPADPHTTTETGDTDEQASHRRTAEDLRRRRREAGQPARARSSTGS